MTLADLAFEQVAEARRHDGLYAGCAGEERPGFRRTISLGAG